MASLKYLRGSTYLAIGAALSLLGSVAMAQTVASTGSDTAATNLIADPGFDNGMSSWGLYATNAKIIKDPANPTNNILRLSASGPVSWTDASTDVSKKVTPGTAYTLTFQSRKSASNINGYVQVQIYDAHWNLLSAPMVLVNSTSFATGTLNFKLPADAHIVHIAAARNGGATTSYVDFDNVSLTPTITEQPSVASTNAVNVATAAAVTTTAAKVSIVTTAATTANTAKTSTATTNSIVASTATAPASPTTANAGQVCISMASSPSQYYSYTPAVTAQTELGMKLDMFWYSAPINDLWRPNYMNPIRSQGWMDYATIGSSDANILQEVINGQYDASITAMAKASIGYPMVVRYFHEFNFVGNPYNNPKLYVQAYRHVHDLWRAAGNNSPFFWTPNVTVSSNTVDFKPFYPGDAYVDIVGLDGYRGQWWYGTPAQLFGKDITEIESITTKPVWIAEVGAISTMSGRPAWITALFDYVIADPRIVGLNYWERDVDTLEGDTASQQAFVAGVKKWRAARANTAPYKGNCTQ